MKKTKILAVVLTSIMLLSAFPVLSAAAETSDVGDVPILVGVQSKDAYTDEADNTKIYSDVRFLAELDDEALIITKRTIHIIIYR